MPATLWFLTGVALVAACGLFVLLLRAHRRIRALEANRSEDALTDARDRAEAANNAKSKFLAAISHEIRTPMNGVLGMAGLLLETGLSAEQKTYADAIRLSGQALLSLIEQILDFSKIESGAIILDQDEVDPRATAESVVELLAPRAHAKTIEIVAVVAPDVPALVRTDGVRLRQVLTNLVGNAVKFTDQGGVRVDLHVEKGHDGDVLRFEVRDTGIGVPPEKREEIFREFVQVDSTHARRFGGSGLGLAISKRLVEAMGGTIGVDAIADGGSLFWFTLPAPSLLEAPNVQYERLAQYRAAIVTHNAILREGITAQIRAAGGEVVPISASEDGMSARIDAVLVDAGTCEAAELQALPQRDIPSIVMLTPAERGRLSLLKELGFAAYLVKPVRQSSLCDRIRGSTEPWPIALSQPSMLHAAALASTPRANHRRSLRILLAEDDPINALLMRQLLRRRGHEVSEVTCGASAVAAVECGHYDMLLTDIHMPGLDGVEATRRIRAAETAASRAPLAIVALTADVLDAGRWACQDAGMDGFLTKPVTPAELDAMIAKLFPDSARAAAE